MTRILSVTLALILGAAIVAVSKTHASTSHFLFNQQSTNGAFRDGVYLGRLDATSGGPAHLATGRWANPAERSAFSVGYRQGYASVSQNKNDHKTIAGALDISNVQSKMSLPGVVAS